MAKEILAVSVVIPCRNEREHVEDCVRSVLTQEPVDGGFEVIISDGMSDDGTREIISRLAKESSLVRLVDNPCKITPSAMNAGILSARGQYIAIMGAHNRYAADYLKEGLNVLQETGADNVGGAMICDSECFIQRAIAAAHHSFFSVGRALWHDPNYEGPADTVFGGIYRREIFDRIGLFDEELVRNQDDELNLRLLRAGGKIWQSPRVKSWYKPRSSLRGLLKQQLQYGYWKVRVIQKHRLPASLRHVVPASFVLLIVLLPLVAIGWHPYLLCSLTASLLAARSRDWKVFFLLPLVFGCYHFAYGYGFLQGVWNFIVMRRIPHSSYAELTRVAPRSEL
jgi:glycosyltransferase involved in cell wall biosynthesis